MSPTDTVADLYGDRNPAAHVEPTPWRFVGVVPYAYLWDRDPLRAWPRASRGLALECFSTGALYFLTPTVDLVVAALKRLAESGRGELIPVRTLQNAAEIRFGVQI